MLLLVATGTITSSCFKSLIATFSLVNVPLCTSVVIYPYLFVGNIQHRVFVSYFCYAFLEVLKCAKCCWQISGHYFH